MGYKIVLKSKDGITADITEICMQIQYSQSMYSQPGKLTFQVIKDANYVIGIKNCHHSIKPGDLIDLTVTENNKTWKVFYGNVFSVTINKNMVYDVIAYDQIRYFNNSDYWALSGLSDKDRTLKGVWDYLTKTLNLQTSIQGYEYYVFPQLDNYVFLNKTYYDILYHCIDETNIKSDGNSIFFIRDNGGELQLIDLIYNKFLFKYEMKTDKKKDYIIIGDGSLMTNYTYTEDIDKDTYNEIMIVTSNQEENDAKISTEIIANEQLIKEWGVLRDIIEIKKDEEKDKAKINAQHLLYTSGFSKKSLTIEALGYPLNVGDWVNVQINDLDFNFETYITEITHTFGTVHTMNLDVVVYEQQKGVSKRI